MVSFKTFETISKSLLEYVELEQKVGHFLCDIVPDNNGIFIISESTRNALRTLIYEEGMDSIEGAEAFIDFLVDWKTDHKHLYYEFFETNDNNPPDVWDVYQIGSIKDYYDYCTKTLKPIRKETVERQTDQVKTVPITSILEMSMKKEKQ